MQPQAASSIGSLLSSHPNVVDKDKKKKDYWGPQSSTGFLEQLLQLSEVSNKLLLRQVCSWPCKINIGDL